MSVEVDREATDDDAPDDDKLIGQVFANRYKIEFLLGEGAMGAVYKAKHVKVGRAFAVKVLHPRLLEDKKVLQRFEREAELAGRLRHPNVIGVVDVGETPDGTRYMVMDFAEGPDLASILNEAPMPPQRVVHLTRQLLEGLYHAHEQGLIHRDFKPENVIVERDSHDAEVPRIVDFGIAILREGGQSTDGPGRLTTNGLVLGTPHYMAPEQAVADPIDHRIDLFALGIMVYEMLSGKLPFDGTGAEVARANLLLDPPPISDRVPYLDVDPLLEAFARRMMAKKRDLRPATAKAARELLDLIGRDREAAAAALGVPVHVARMPMQTQDVAPVRHHGNHEGTFPPPLRAEEKTPRIGPPMSTPRAVPTPATVLREQDISTQTAEPIAPRRRAPIIIAGVVGAGVLIAGAAVLLSGKDKAKAHETIVMTAGSDSEVQPVGSAQVEPIAPPTHEGSAIETGSAAPIADTGSGSASPTDAGSAIAAVQTTDPAKTKSTKTKSTKTKQTKVVETKTTPVETKVAPPVETKAAGPITAGALASQYQAVGSALKSLEQAKGADAAADLWPRYRFIRISDAMATQDKRDAAAKILAKLTTEIAARKH